MRGERPQGPSISVFCACPISSLCSVRALQAYNAAALLAWVSWADALLHPASHCVCGTLQAHDAMNTLKTNLRQEHWETLSWGSTCHQLLTPWQLATLLVEAHPHWSVPCVCPALQSSLVLKPLP